MINLVRNHRRRVLPDHAGRTRISIDDQLLMTVHDGVLSVLRECHEAAEANQLGDAVFLARLVTWLNVWAQAIGNPEVSAKDLDGFINLPVYNTTSLSRWISAEGGPVEAARTLLYNAFEIGKTRLAALVSVLADEVWLAPDGTVGGTSIDDLNRAAHNNTGMTAAAYREFSMRLVGYSQAAIEAATRVQQEMIEVPMYFGALTLNIPE